MPDWKKIVREKLGSLPLTNGRKDEVVEELAQQLESAYEEALAQGINEQEALRRSLAQFKDWEKLRGELFHSVEGTRLPVWEQNGFFSPRRLAVWIALALALLFLAAPAFRQAIAILPVPGTDPTAWSSRVFSERALRRIELSGDTQKYARTLAFVALHSPKEDDLRAMHAAEKAIALDPQLTWISAKVSHAAYLIPGYDPHPWIERLKAWDPQNAFPHLLEASANVHGDWETHWARYNAATRELPRALAADPRWRIPMEKAFSAPRVDFYAAQQFALDRQVLQEQGFDRPDMLLAAGWSQPLPDFLLMNMYEDIQLKDVGEAAEKAGRPDEALAAYSAVAQFAERLPAEPSYFMQFFSARYRREAYERMIPLLRRQGRVSEAATVEAVANLLATNPTRSSLLSTSLGITANRSARVVLVSEVLVAVFGVATAFWLISVAALKWNPNLGRGLNRLASVLCYAPPSLILGCLALFLGYYPYARPVGQFASSREFYESHGLFLVNLYGFWNSGPFMEIWLDRMLWPLAWCAGVALVGALLLWWVRRQRPDRTRAA
jgi:tetratricopeptide (TPR) repeat protein